MFSLHEKDFGPAPVLLVDDRWEDNFLLQRLLRVAKVDHPIDVAGGGQEAIEYLRVRLYSGTRKLPCLMIVDLNMPGVSGFELLEWVREQPTLNPVAVVVLSTSEDEADIQRAFELGAQSFLTKYPSSSTLAEIVNCASLPYGQRPRFPGVLPAGEHPWNPSSFR